MVHKGAGNGSDTNPKQLFSQLSLVSNSCNYVTRTNCLVFVKS